MGLGEQEASTEDSRAKATITLLTNAPPFVLSFVRSSIEPTYPRSRSEENQPDYTRIVRPIVDLIQIRIRLRSLGTRPNCLPKERKSSLLPSLDSDLHFRKP
ncbi:hypothetical protein PGT21_017798 [Puccinia graminis f. sp. tritici]|uniref:Uncharacterized protein n=1 Tax=Puccinia graminis f. sp. tritici TaxID=56615 RepID=A0A5B0LQX7_PUCGR|nr:hypothetical protein PGT21_017798 [Puccinia graminis f. sp. tritici]